MEQEMEEGNKNLPQDPQSELACDNSISRKEFLATLVKRAAVAGTLVAAPKILDHFLVPPAYARSSTNHRQDTGHSDTAHNDTGSIDTGDSDLNQTSPFHDQGTDPFHDLGTSPFHDFINE